MTENKISKIIVDSAVRGLRVNRQVPIASRYKDMNFEKRSVPISSSTRR